ncbi:hypothetical protein M409DRAFT_30755 [Zasmidium cellare ATCC 36951]|uniref:Uncharacterized protein n=1 Tax=Zasmidium cellare ATCC 36951 TaxID=1080233 RepID=A0A6A6BXL9_ZASCE|nr:uncharacterized protein M409DRAFT_30755 [Zasmidium cellare ATCC 36951]KAF2158798.1 hypothetical protein M409DRAFT_30755 [Zasmidium cellare ATCC 36951]
MSSKHTADATQANPSRKILGEQQAGVVADLEPLTLHGTASFSKPLRRDVRSSGLQQDARRTLLSDPKSVVNSHAIHIGPTDDPYSEAIANRNVAHLQTTRENPSRPRRVEKSEEDGAGADQKYELGRREDVETILSQAPAVTHETRIVNTHEIITKPMTREIHNHHMLHRVQPIDDIEVLPPRHFAPHTSGRGYVEIPTPKSSEGIQERVRDAFESNAEENRAEARKNIGVGRVGPEGKYAEWSSSDGVHHSESVWVHDPQLETAAKDAGETVPTHLDIPRHPS